MVIKRAFREQLVKLGESPACVWADDLGRGMTKMLLPENVIYTWPYRGHFVSPPFADIWSYSSRIEAVNKYFRIKAGQVFGNTRALEILAELRSKKVIPRDEWGQFDINENAVVLAMLSAAGFCEVNDYSVSITDEGKQFLDDILE